MIEFRQVSLKYPYDDYAVLKDLTFTLDGNVNTVLCDSQSGKSSICKLLTREFAPTGGQITIDGCDVTGITNEALGILYLPSNPAFFEGRSVKYNVLYPLKVRKVAKPDRLKRFDEVARQIGLEYHDVKLSKLTLPDRKRVAIARGLTVSRSIVLLDDFCDNAEQIDEIISLFSNATVVILTSDVKLARGNVVVLDGGYSVYQGDVAGAIKCKQDLNWIVDMLRSE